MPLLGIRSQLIVQQSTNSNLVNVILKPMKVVKATVDPVKYFIYRGLEKSSFIKTGTTDAIVPRSRGSELINKFWKDFNKWSNKQNPTPSTPTIEVLGYDQNPIANTESLRSVFMNAHEVQTFVVEEGMWIGNFAANTPIGMDIVLADSGFMPTMEYVRKNNNIINATSLIGFEEKKKRDEILAFIDPATFYGLYYKIGIKTDGGSQKIRKDNLYTQVIEKFHTKNKVYLDIRNEEGYSYNFFRNYEDGSGYHLKLGIGANTPTLAQYETHKWSILAIDATTTTNNALNDINIALHTDDNPEPLIYQSDIINTPSNKYGQFIGIDNILSVGSIWSKQLLFQAFNYVNSGVGQGIANYLKVSYNRQVPYSGDNKAIPVKTHFHTNLFGSIHHEELEKVYDGYNYLDLGGRKYSNV